MMAKQVVQLRKQQEKLYKGKAQINGVSLMAKSAQSTQAMMKGMSTATAAMTQANAAMQPAEIQRMAMEFERQSEQMEMAQETMYADRDLRRPRVFLRQLGRSLVQSLTRLCLHPPCVVVCRGSQGGCNR